MGAKHYICEWFSAVKSSWAAQMGFELLPLDTDPEKHSLATAVMAWCVFFAEHAYHAFA
jgi:hypothetical protein